MFSPPWPGITSIGLKRPSVEKELQIELIGIAIQGKVMGPQPLKVAPEILKTKKRSIDTAALKLPNYNSGQRVGPPTTQSIY